MTNAGLADLGSWSIANFCDLVYIGLPDRKPPWICPADKRMIYHRIYPDLSKLFSMSQLQLRHATGRKWEHHVQYDEEYCDFEAEGQY